MDIKYSLRERDYIDFNIKSFRESDYILKLFLFRKLVAAGIFFSFSYIFLDRTIYGLRERIVLFLILISISTSLELIFTFCIIKMKIRKEMKSDISILGSKTLSFRQDGIYDLSEKGDDFIGWEEVKFIDNGRDYIYIFILSRSGYIIPKSSFKDQKTLEDFLKLVERYIT